jgi:hypothetical protein
MARPRDHHHATRVRSEPDQRRRYEIACSGDPAGELLR